MACQDQSPPVQGFHSVSSSNYVSPSHLEPYFPSVVVTKHVGGTIGSSIGQEASTSDRGRHQATAQLEDRSRLPPIVGLDHPTLLLPCTPLQALPPTVEVEAPTIIPPPPSETISHHNYLHSCRRNANYSSHITSENYTWQEQKTELLR